MGKDIRKKIGKNEYVLVWVPAEDTTLGGAHYIDTTDYQIPTPEEIRESLRELQKLQQFKFDVEEELKVLGDEVDRGCWNPLNVWDLLFAIKTFVDKKFEELLE